VEKIWPHIDNDKVIWLQGVDDEIKRRVFRKAKGFLSTNWEQYHEMFGIVNIEALASGCPVIGWGHKTQPSAMNIDGGEIITHEEHGFINEYNDYSDGAREASITQAVEYVNQLDNIDRAKCHQLFKDRFTAREMAEKHLKYYQIVKERGSVHNVTSELC
jgi:glycosyltransferase involved in cell wall biosynthesis